MRGRKPHPTWRKTLDGNPGKRATNKDEPALPPPPPAFDEVPPELLGNERAVVEWNRVAPLLRTRRQITDADRTTLIALCLEWSRYLEATAALSANGLLIEGRFGYSVVSPYLSIARASLAACGRLWPELGMTPSSRARVKTDAGEVDAFSEFDKPIARGA